MLCHTMYQNISGGSLKGVPFTSLHNACSFVYIFERIFKGRRRKRGRRGKKIQQQQPQKTYNINPLKQSQLVLKAKDKTCLKQKIMTPTLKKQMGILGSINNKILQNWNIYFFSNCSENVFRLILIKLKIQLGSSNQKY